MDPSDASAAASRTAGADHSYNGSDQRTPPHPRLRDQSLIMSAQAGMKLTPNQKLMVALLRCCNFFNGCTHNGWNHVNNVYYVIFLGWTPLKVRCTLYSMCNAFNGFGAMTNTVVLALMTIFIDKGTAECGFIRIFSIKIIVIYSIHLVQIHTETLT